MKSISGDPSSPDKTTDAYTRLKAAVMSYRSFPGTFFNIRTLAEKMKVSPTPIREALIKLVHEGVIGFVPGRGYYVKPLDLDDLRADYELTFLMLRFAIERSANPFDPHDLPLLPANHSHMPDEGDLARACAAYVESFYERIALMGGNLRLVHSVRQFNDRARVVHLLALKSMPRPLDVPSDLNRLAHLLQSGSRKQALRMLELRCQETMSMLPELVKTIHLRAQHVPTPLEELV
ncbi:GntR family transcriptional regulator [Neorhizobium sp. S3-V5DH]|jgi:DNA-binding GntR family transcriptional regulator|uniref:GntR family transcriptional regulator n=3 Tax=Neorhizobium TaxID=1525371 RepID=UPI000DD5671B|nr:GntR family transcriptional regulator [Neorhizobium sp. S3-V5DH]